MTQELADVLSAVENLSYEDRGNVSDTFHTFNELYEFRKLYNAALFNEWARGVAVSGAMSPVAGGEVKKFKVEPVVKYDVHKSWRHHDGELCFGGGWFIVVAVLPSGQISNHYKEEDWDLFQVPAVDKTKYEFDGHTPQDVLERLKGIL